MSLPTRTPAEGVSPARFALGLLIALSLCAAPAHATHYVVDPNGGGDFTTIQAALDAQAANFRDTVLVMPGTYLETPALPAVSGTPAWIVGTGGAPVTSMSSITAPNDDAVSSWRSYTLEGFTFVERPVLYHQGPTRARFAHCVFQQGLFSDPRDSECPPIANDCDFFGPTTLLDCYLVWTSLRFHAAPLTITHATGAGSFLLQDCTFEGPTDTLVSMPWAFGDYGGFDRCRFSNAGRGVLYGDGCVNVDMPVTACVFLDIAGDAVATSDTSASTSGTRRASVSILDSRFERCGTAVRWVHGWSQQGGWNDGISMVRDTILDSTGDGVVFGPQNGGGLSSCIIEGSGGHGALGLQSVPAAAGGQMNPASYTISGTRFANNQLDGLCIRDSIAAIWTHYPYAPVGFVGPVVTGSTFAGNGGAGLRVAAGSWRVTGCVAAANGSHGFALLNTSPGFGLVTSGNTSASNLGDGFRIDVLGAPRDSVDVVTRNLSAGNAGAGFGIPAAGSGSFAFNDAWANAVAAYVGPASPADSNLTVDPLFCDLAGGDLGLQQGSPCGAGGVYGLIGARPESCPAVAGVEPSTPAGVAFAVRPSVARGSVEFVVPAGTGDARVELYDVGGRAVWRTTVSATGGSVRWRGEGTNGRVPAGLYWARYTRGSEGATKRLVWLEQ